jgi:hypothetical protein
MKTYQRKFSVMKLFHENGRFKKHNVQISSNENLSKLAKHKCECSKLVVLAAMCNKELYRSFLFSG